MGRRFETLDGLRGVAAIAILTRHAPDRLFADHVFPGSYLAVDLFFLLSGFVMSHAYAARIAGGLGFGRFMALRLVRLYPLHLIAFAISALPVVVQAARGKLYGPLSHVLASYLGTLFFLPTPPGLAINTYAFPANYPEWSLFWEIAANALFALVLLVGGMRRWLAGLILAGCVAVAWISLTYNGVDAGAGPFDFWAGAGRVLFSFFVGVLLHRLWRAGRLKLSIPPWAAAAALLAIFAVPASSPFRWVEDLIAVMVLFPLLVALSTGEQRAGWAEILGYASYGVYVLQEPLIALFEEICRRAHIDAGGLGLAGTALILVVTTLAALVLDRVYDGPIRARLNRSLMSARPPTPKD